MKNNLFIFTFLFAGIIHSQNFGMHFGGTLSTQENKDVLRDNSELYNFENIIGLNIGVDYKHQISQYFFLISSLNFLQNGYKQDTRNLKFPNEAVLNYLNLPLILLLDSPKTKFGLNIKLGGYFSYLIGGNAFFKNSPNERPIEEYFNKIDFGVTGGIGIKINRKFTLDFIYNFGLNNIADDGDNTFIKTKINNRVFNVNLIYWMK